MKKCYLSGPITGTTDYHDRFISAFQNVFEMGMVPINPVTLKHDHDKKYESYLKESLKAMLDCQCIYLMTGYEKSKGATIERFIAQRLNYEIFYQ